MPKLPETTRCPETILVPTDTGRMASRSKQLDYAQELYLKYLVHRGWIFSSDIERKYGTHGRANYETLIEMGYAKIVEQ